MAENEMENVKEYGESGIRNQTIDANGGSDFVLKSVILIKTTVTGNGNQENLKEKQREWDQELDH